ncbi:fatty acyl-AMP ligase [Plantactinospora sp. KLBMP9567]|uniref:fatty acyl-AMP ligase n=1 Tax=Plantactinospora sp. KLBMP9567 TaxID=3085900 RepID=UPI002981C16D|nr:fatty acyl-AMP ligase [Plantactinospora sp. KLBMP9567]MDW5328079.1 fatty acyl-AMP ligase [Plantactinospora sp. KLBMP9567]
MGIVGLVERIVRHADQDPDREAVVLLRWDEREERSEILRYGELDRAARELAGRLRDRCRPGDRALLLYPTGLEFVKSIVGCMYAGVVPVPAPLPDGDKHHLMRATGIALDSDPRIVLTDSASLVTVSDWMSQDGLDRLLCTATDLAGPAAPGAWDGPTHISPSALALLRYTTGSTSDPKGVMISHENLAHNLEVFRDAFSLTSRDRSLGWLPLHDGAGLIEMLLEPLYRGAATVLMAADDFFADPARWLKAIDKCDVRLSSAPGFAYRLCARKVTDEQVRGLDLARWEHACVGGADPIEPEPLIEFVDRFAPAGFRREAVRVGYHITESTLFVSGTRPGQPLAVERFDPSRLEQNILLPAAADAAAARSLVSSGTVNGLDVKIVDPDTTAVLPDGRLGEIWIRGRSVARGYWRREVESDRVFGATTADGEGGYLRTGDLGVWSDAELYVLGRMREMLVIGGRSLYPHDMEKAVRTSDTRFADLTGTVFAVPSPRQEIVVLHEVQAEPTDPATLSSLARSVKDWLSRCFGVRVANVAFLRPGKVRKSPGGKVQRALMRELFMADALDPVYEDLDIETRRRYRAVGPPLAVSHGKDFR